jgi:predicted RNA binding protein YcfA (HicA-like mRNA interferase family)
MPRLPSLSSDKIVRALQKKGFRYAPKRGKGSHVALVGTDHNGRTRLAIVPKRKDIPAGTLQSILEQADLTREEFLELI